MTVTVLLFARLKREAGIESLSLPLEGATDVAALAARVEQQLSLSLRGCMVAVNESYAAPETPLRDGDEVAFLPPVAGGTLDQQGWLICAVTSELVDLASAARFLERPAWGAQAYFVGTVRSPNKGVRVAYIDYEAYPPMAKQVMRAAADLARERYGELGVYIAHRTGRLQPAEVSILIGVGSPHRRAALEACDFLIEHLKVHLPVWKLEMDEHGEHWVEGQTGAPTLE